MNWIGTMLNFKYIMKIKIKNQMIKINNMKKIIYNMKIIKIFIKMK